MNRSAEKATRYRERNARMRMASVRHSRTHGQAGVPKPYQHFGCGPPQMPAAMFGDTDGGDEIGRLRPRLDDVAPISFYLSFWSFVARP